MSHKLDKRKKEKPTDEQANLTTIAGPWYFWQGRCSSKAPKPVTLSGNPTFTKV